MREEHSNPVLGAELGLNGDVGEDGRDARTCDGQRTRRSSERGERGVPRGLEMLVQGAHEECMQRVDGDV